MLDGVMSLVTSAFLKFLAKAGQITHSFSYGLLLYYLRDVALLLRDGVFKINVDLLLLFLRFSRG